MLHGEDWSGLKILRGKEKEDKKPEILTEREITKMIEAAANERDQALLAVTYEGGFRIGELAGLTWGNIFWTDYGAKVRVYGKTGERVVPLVASSGYLRKWLFVPYYDANNDRIDPEALVFCSLNGKPMSYQALFRIFKRAARGQK